MQYTKATIVSAALAATAMSAYVPTEPWTTLTPTGSISGAFTDYSLTFGIAVQPIATSNSAASATTSAKAKRAQAISQITDGQIQASTSTAPHSTSTSSAKSTAAAVSQITDGQIQATTSTAVTTPKVTKTSAAAVSQITDGQIQATTSTAVTTPKVTKTSAAAVSQIGDGQIQATTSTSSAAKSTAAAVSQIGDGQVQASTTTLSSSAKSTASAASQIADGQVQASTTTPSSSAEASSSSSSTSSSSASASNPVSAQSCSSNGTLSMTLEDGILKDSMGRIGSIVANRQFQFDGPPPQAGAIYAKGWSVTPEGNLAIGDEDVFYQCLSGNFYNLYDQSIGGQCHPIHLEVVDLVSC